MQIPRLYLVCGAGLALAALGFVPAASFLASQEAARVVRHCRATAERLGAGWSGPSRASGLTGPRLEHRRRRDLEALAGCLRRTDLACGKVRWPWNDACDPETRTEMAELSEEAAAARDVEEPAAPAPGSDARRVHSPPTAAPRPRESPPPVPETGAVPPHPPTARAHPPKRSIPVLEITENCLALPGGFRGTPPPPWGPLHPALWAGTRTDPVPAEHLVETAAASVYPLFAAVNLKDLDRGTVHIGSAVAVTPNVLLTNYHVVQHGTTVVTMADGIPYQARLAAADVCRDKAVLIVDRRAGLVPIPGLRASPSLRLGESVYAVGTPGGGNGTFSQGVVAALRTLAGVRWIQTTSSVIPASSGGGLYDQAGNLIGVTSYVVPDEPGAYVALAIEEFWSKAR